MPAAYENVINPRTLFEKMRHTDALAWPSPLSEAAFHGLAGDIVRLIEPATESDVAGLLIQLLCAFGVHVGRTPYYSVEDSRHFPNLFAVLVGDTAKARKGTAWGRVRGVLSQVFEPPEIVSGLSSGEGLKFAVRDPTERDPGVQDKRLLVVEPEFASALRATQRNGNTLSPTLREAWDSGNLRVLTKHDPIVATDAHVSVIGHITVEELRAELSATDTANGFANRFLFVCVRRSKELPFGGEVDEGRFAELAQRFAAAAEAARRFGNIRMDCPARLEWARIYSELSGASPGLYGAVTARAEAHCVRIALVYALLDGVAVIDASHLQAALAVWSYCAESARCIFGDALGDRVADELLRSLRAAGDQGMTRTAIRDLYGRNQSNDRVSAALTLLLGRRLVRRETRPSGGRPTEVWFATGAR